MSFDHAIYVAADLEAATAHVSSVLGVPPAGGGEHEGQGTHNQVLPFGGGYLEVLALVDPTAPPPSPIAAAVAGRLASHGDGLHAWAVHVSDVASVADRLDTPVMTIARDGFSARLAGVGEAMTEPFLPFFIERDPGVPPPYGEGPGIEVLEIEGDATRLRDWLGELPPYVRVRAGDGGVRGITVGGRELR
jgi:hypothetical protein